MKLTTYLACLAFLFFGSHLSAAETVLRFSNVLTDNMVLQRDQDLTCWGWANKGATVELLLTQSRDEVVAFVGEEALAHEDKQKNTKELHPKMGSARIAYTVAAPEVFQSARRRVTAGKDGRWKTTLGQHKASFTPTYLAAKSGEEVVVIKNLLIGEVWIASGQSNMRWGGRAGMWEGRGLLPSGLRTASHQAGSATPMETIARPLSWKVAADDGGGGTIGYLFAKFLHEQLKVPVGVINIAQGGSFAYEWCDRKLLEDMGSPTIDAVITSSDERRKTNPKARTRGPAALFNARFFPIRNLNVAGVIYLQGENEALTSTLAQYQKTFPGVIQSYRQAMGRPDLPFGIITLMGMGSSDGYGISSYSIAREIHLKTHLATPHTGYIVSHDIGGGIHPSYKRPLAERACYWALRDVYGVVKNATRTRIKKVTFEDGKALISFEDVKLQDGKWVDPKDVLPKTSDQNQIAGFMIAGADKKWFPGKVRGVGTLDGPTTLTISNPMVDEPVALRYGWEGWSKANLGPFHDPMRPYRTDSWPLLQEDKVYAATPGTPSPGALGYLEVHDMRNRMLELPLQEGVKVAGVNLLKRHAYPKPMMLEMLSGIEGLLEHFDPDSYTALAAELREKALHTVPPRYWRHDRLSAPARTAKWGWFIERVLRLEEFPGIMKGNVTSPAVQEKLDVLKKTVAGLRKELEALEDAKPYAPEELIDAFLPIAEKEKEVLLKKGVDLRQLEKEMAQRPF